MKMRLGDPGSDFALFTLNGQLMGFLVEADTDEGFVVQQQPGQSPIRLDGLVNYVGSTLITDPSDVRARVVNLGWQRGLVPRT